jgi:hypothetical protein
LVFSPRKASDSLRQCGGGLWIFYFGYEAYMLFIYLHEIYVRDEHEATEENVQKSSRERSLYDYGLQQGRNLPPTQASAYYALWA